MRASEDKGTLDLENLPPSELIVQRLVLILFNPLFGTYNI